MGWSSGSEIFDPIAQALIDLKASAKVKRKVLGPLLHRLRENDWDTYDESFAAFARDPIIMAIFYDQGCCNEVGGWDGEAEGTLDVAQNYRRWLLKCSECGLVGHSEKLDADGHDGLVRLWAEHDRDKHEGSGVVAESMLLSNADEVTE